MEPRNQSFPIPDVGIGWAAPITVTRNKGLPRPAEHGSFGDRIWPRPTFHLGWLYYNTQPPLCEDRLCDWNYKCI